MKIRIIKDSDHHHNLSQREREDVFKRGLNIFKKVVSDTGILQEAKRREYYESPSEKRRRKKKESNLIRKKNSNKNDRYL
jgi:ribosomal protein S21